MNELNPYMKLSISDTEGTGDRKAKRWEEGTESVVLPVEFTLYFFFSVFQKVQNYKPRAASSQSLGA